MHIMGKWCTGGSFKYNWKRIKWHPVERSHFSSSIFKIHTHTIILIWSRKIGVRLCVCFFFGVIASVLLNNITSYHPPSIDGMVSQYLFIGANIICCAWCYAFDWVFVWNWTRESYSRHDCRFSLWKRLTRRIFSHITSAYAGEG